MEEHIPVYDAGLEDILAIDREIREKVKEYFG